MSMAEYCAFTALKNDRPGDNHLTHLDVCNSTCFPNIRMLLSGVGRCQSMGGALVQARTKARRRGKICLPPNIVARDF